MPRWRGLEHLMQRTKLESADSSVAMSLLSLPLNEPPMHAAPWCSLSKEYCFERKSSSFELPRQTKVSWVISSASLATQFLTSYRTTAA